MAKSQGTPPPPLTPFNAYVQSLLDSKCATLVQLPPELWLEEWKGKYFKPIVLLVKSLYGHPEAGAHWENHL